MARVEGSTPFGMAIGLGQVCLHDQAVALRPNTSEPAKGHKTYPYLLAGLRIDRPNQVWCADITCVGEMVPRAIS